MSQTPTPAAGDGRRVAKFILLGVALGIVAGLVLWGILSAVGVEPGYATVAVPIMAVAVFLLLRSGRSRRT